MLKVPELCLPENAETNVLCTMKNSAISRSSGDPVPPAFYMYMFNVWYTVSFRSSVPYLPPWACYFTTL